MEACLEEVELVTAGAPEDRSAEQQLEAGPRTKDDDVRGTPRGQTFGKLKGDNGIRDQGLKQQLRLRMKGNINETARQNIEMRVAKLAVEFPIGL
jgi:hypothetical protein